MELFIFLGAGLFIVYYLFRPISKIEEKNFKSKNNW